jgi:hypothetical protein
MKGMHFEKDTASQKMLKIIGSKPFSGGTRVRNKIQHEGQKTPRQHIFSVFLLRPGK